MKKTIQGCHFLLFYFQMKLTTLPYPKNLPRSKPQRKSYKKRPKVRVRQLSQYLKINIAYYYFCQKKRVRIWFFYLGQQTLMKCSITTHISDPDVQNKTWSRSKLLNGTGTGFNKKYQGLGSSNILSKIICRIFYYVKMSIKTGFSYFVWYCVQFTRFSVIFP